MSLGSTPSEFDQTLIGSSRVVERVSLRLGNDAFKAEQR
jgi:hypothetical protein